MALPELIVLDVGHGNCAILRDTEAVTMIDCPRSPVSFETLDQLGIGTIDYLLISHADVDHIGGLTNLLKKVGIHHIYLNPDAGKRGKTWREIRTALHAAAQRGTKVHAELTSTSPGSISSGQVQIDILAPSLKEALGGSSGEDSLGRPLTSNSMSAVVGLTHRSCRVALLPGDIDDVGLDNFRTEQKGIEAQILIFPHHGGTPGSAHGQEFAQRLCEIVKPHLVIFSHGRNHLDNPREDIVQGVVLAVPDTHIMCTQLSRNCAKDLLSSDFSHLTDLPAAGYTSNICCGGTISIQLNGKETTYTPLRTTHRAFIDNKTKVPTPLCLRHLINLK